MTHALAPWLRKGALAVAALALLAGVPLRSQAGTLVGVYEKSGFEYLVNLGDSSSLTTLAFDANIPEFSGSTDGALFTIVGVQNRNLVDSFGISIGNVIFTSSTGSATGVTDDGIISAQTRVAGFGTADSWFDLIPTIVSGAPGTHATLAPAALNQFTKRVDNTFFGAFPFSTAGTIAGGNLDIALFSGLASDAFDNTPQIISQLTTVHVTSTGISFGSVPEPASLALFGVALAVTASLRRRTS